MAIWGPPAQPPSPSPSCLRPRSSHGAFFGVRHANLWPCSSPCLPRNKNTHFQPKNPPGVGSARCHAAHTGTGHEQRAWGRCHSPRPYNNPVPIPGPGVPVSCRFHPKNSPSPPFCPFFARWGAESRRRGGGAEGHRPRPHNLAVTRSPLPWDIWGAARTSFVLITINPPMGLVGSQCPPPAVCVVLGGGRSHGGDPDIPKSPAPLP